MAVIEKKKALEAEKKVELVDAQCKVKDQSISKLRGENKQLKAELKNKADENTEEMANAKADDTLWVRDLTIQ